MLYDFEGISPQLEGDRIFVAPGADVIGNVHLCEDVSIWFNCTLRGDIEIIRIGRGTNVQDGSTVHTDTNYPALIGENITIGHNCIIHGCTIGNGSLIGMGSVILTGAKIGRNCLIGGGSLVTGGLDVPDGMLVLGSPAKIIKPLGEAALDRMRKNAVRYVVNKDRYLKEGI